MKISTSRIVDLFRTNDCSCRGSYCFGQNSGKDIGMFPGTPDKAINRTAKSAPSGVIIVFLDGEPVLEPQ